MAGTLLHETIISSTIWGEAHHIRIVWITMLALKDENHFVSGTVPGLARLAFVTLTECEEALERLSSPDPYSRTQDFEGRRIEAVEGGWLILNGEKYREFAKKEKQREKWRRQKRNQRGGVDNVADVHPLSTPVPPLVLPSPTPPPQADADADPECSSTHTSEGDVGGVDEGRHPIVEHILSKEKWTAFAEIDAMVLAKDLIHLRDQIGLERVLEHIDEAHLTWAPSRSVYDHRNGLHGYLVAFLSNRARQDQEKAQGRKGPKAQFCTGCGKEFHVGVGEHCFNCADELAGPAVPPTPEQKAEIDRIVGRVGEALDTDTEGGD